MALGLIIWTAGAAMREREKKKNSALQRQISGSWPRSTGGGRGVGRCWVYRDGVTLGSQRVLFCSAPSLSPWITVSMTLSEGW